MNNLQEEKEFSLSLYKKYIYSGLLLLLSLILVMSSFEIVSEGNRGLKFTFGSLGNDVVSPGLVFKIPFVQSINEYTIRPMVINTLVEVGTQGAITKDNQTIGANIDLYYKYKEDQLISMYSGYGPLKIKEILNSITMESFKSVIGTYNIFELPLNQVPILKQVVDSVKMKIVQYPIELTELKITNYDWSDAFDAQIEATMKKAQEVKQKEQELAIAEQEAQKQVKEALAEKSAAIARAEGLKQKTILEAEAGKEKAKLDAEAKVLEGEGIRKYNESIKATLDIQVKLRQLDIDMVKAEKWDGKFVPTNNYGPIPFMNGSIQK